MQSFSNRLNAASTDVSVIQLGMALALISSLLFSLKPIFIKQAYAYGANAELLMIIRMWIACPFYAAILYFERHSIKPFRRYIPALIFMGFIGYFLSSYLDFLALEKISAQAERIILYAYPSLVVLLKSIADKSLPSRRTIVALVVIYSGILLLLPGELNLNGSTFGLILMGLCALSFAFYVWLSKPLISAIGTTFFTSIAMLSACFWTQLHLIHLKAENLIQFPTEVYAYALGLAFFCTVIPSYTMSAAIARIGPENAAITGTTGPVFTVIFSIMILGEVLTVFHVAGLICVIIGVFLLGRASKTQ